MHRNPFFAAAWLLLAALASSAWAASPADDDEYLRRVEEVSSLADRGLYSAAEGKFAAVRDSEEFEPGADLYVVGARLARATGDVGLMRERLKKAVELGADDKIQGWLDQVGMEYRRVEIVSKAKELEELRAEPAPFNPDHAAAISYARSRLLVDGKFEGYLPLGHYLLAEVTFDITDETELVELKLTRKGEEK